MAILSDLKQKIISSKLTPEQQFELISVCALRTEKELTGLLALFSESSDWIEIFYDNYKNKVDAFFSNDKESLQDILEEEKRLIESA